MATAIVMADEGLIIIMSTFFKNTAAQNLKLKLFATNVTPAHNMTTATFTEANGGGYAAITLTNNSWTVADNSPVDAVYAQQTFTFTGALTTNATVYGYYVTNNAEDKVIWAQLFDATFTPANNGDNIVITPKLQVGTGTPT